MAAGGRYTTEIEKIGLIENIKVYEKFFPAACDDYLLKYHSCTPGTMDFTKGSHDG